MKKSIIVSIVLLFTCFISKGQGGWTRPNNSYGTIQNRSSVDSTFFFPTGCGAPSLQGYNLKKAASFFDSCNHRYWLFDPKLNAWDTIKAKGATNAINGVALVVSGDTVILGGLINRYTAEVLNGFPLNIVQNGISNSTATDSSAFRAVNNSPAATATDSLVSPGYDLSANSWKTNFGGSTRNVRFRIDELAVSSTVFGAAYFRIRSNVNNASKFTTLYSIDHNGVWQQNINILTALIGPTDQNGSSLRFGTSALAAVTSTTSLAGNNIGIGNQSLFLHKRGDFNVAFGNSSLQQDTSGTDNTAIGYKALFTNINGTANTAVGSTALSGNLRGSANTMVGYGAGSLNDTSNNTGVGYLALFGNTKGDVNTAVGGNAMFSNTIGYQNSAFGFNALHANTTGIKNGALSTAALEENTTGSNNTASGMDALLHNTTGSNNSAYGQLAGAQNIAGGGNISIGQNTMRNSNNHNSVITIGNDWGYLKYDGQNGTANNLRHVIGIGVSGWSGRSNIQIYGDDSIAATKFYGIPLLSDTTGLSVLMFKRSDSTFQRVPASLLGGGGGTGGIDDVLAINQLFTTDRFIDANGNGLIIDNTSFGAIIHHPVGFPARTSTLEWGSNSNVPYILLRSEGASNQSELNVQADSISIQAGSNGTINIDSLRAANIGDDVMTWGGVGNGKWGHTPQSSLNIPLEQVLNSGSDLPASAYSIDGSGGGGSAWEFVGFNSFTITTPSLLLPTLPGSHNADDSAVVWNASSKIIGKRPVSSDIANGRAVSQTAANTNVLTQPVGATDRTFQISANVLVTASTTHNFTVTVDYTDEANTARTVTLSFSQLVGTIITAITNITGAAPYEGVGLTIRAKSGTNIVFKTAGTFTTVTYNIDANIIQLN